MADESITYIRKAKNLFLNGQIDKAKEALQNGLQLYPKNITMQDLLEQYQNVGDTNMADDIQENEDRKQTKIRNKTEHDRITNKCKRRSTEEDNDETKYKNLITNISFQMRLKALTMELNAAKTYSLKELIENENDTKKKIHTIETCIGAGRTALDLYDFKKAESELLIAESLSNELMRKIKQVVKKDLKKEEVKEPEEDIEVPDYRSEVTVRGTKEDVSNCILKATIAMDNGKYDRAESLLLKAERICPTKNARDLLKQVRAAKESKLNSDLTESPIQTEEVANTVEEKEEVSKSEDSSVNAVKCLRAFEEALTSGSFVKAERLLNKAKRFDPSLDIEKDSLKLVRAVKEQKQNSDPIEKCTEAGDIVNTTKEVEEESKLEDNSRNAVKCLKAFEQAFTTGNFVKAERLLNKAKKFDPSLNVEEKQYQVTAAINNKIMEEKRKEQIEKAERERKMAGEYLYMAMKACGVGDFENAENNFLQAKSFDPKLNLELELLTIKTKMTSESNKEKKDTDKTGPQETLTESDIKYAAEYLYNAKKAYDGGDFKKAQRNFEGANSFDPSLDLRSYLSKCRDEIEHIEKLKEKNQAKSSLEINNSETKFSTLKDKNHEEMEMEVERRRKDVIKKGKSKIRKNEQPEINRTSKGPINNKNTTNKQAKNDDDGCRSPKNIEKEKSHPKLSPENKEVKNLISMAEQAISNEKFDYAINVLNTAEELYPTEQAKKLLKNISEINFTHKETPVPINCYEFPVEANESDETEALKCIKIAQAAFQENLYDKAEHFLLKSLRICDNQRAKSFLETVLKTKAQYNSKVTVETENIYNKRVTGQFLDEYDKCIDLTTKAIVEGNLTIAERFLSKAIRINPNDNDRKHLKHIQDVKALVYSSDEATTSKTVNIDDDLKRQIDAEMFINWAIDAMVCNMFHVARHYLKWALEERPNEETRELLRNVQIQMDYRHGGHSRPKNDIIIEANKLLTKADEFIRIGDLEKAESFLVVSWDMCKSQRTVSVHKQFLEARLAQFERDNQYNRDGSNSLNIFESDKLVKLALDKYEKKKFGEAEELLTRAAVFYSSVRIDKLLVDIREGKNRGDGVFKTIYKYAVNKFS